MYEIFKKGWSWEEAGEGVRGQLIRGRIGQSVIFKADSLVITSVLLDEALLLRFTEQWYCNCNWLEINNSYWNVLCYSQPLFYIEWAGYQLAPVLWYFTSFQ